MSNKVGFISGLAIGSFDADDSFATIDLVDGNGASVSHAGHARIRFNLSTQQLEQSINTGNWVGIATGTSAGSSLAKYIIQTADASLPNAQTLSTLGTGIVKNTTGTGVLSIAIANTDFPAVSAQYIVATATAAPPQAQNLGALTSGILQQTVSAGVATLSIKNSTALSVLGRATNSTGIPDDIQATASGQFLRRDGNNTLGFGPITTADLPITIQQTTDTAVANLAELALVPVINFSTKDRPSRFVNTVKDSFYLDKTNTDTADGITIINALGGTGRWIRLNISSLYWAAQATWYINSVNGNDENEGDAPGNALKTRSEYARRTDGQQLITAVTINIVTDLLSTDTTLPFRPQTSVLANGASGFKIKYQGTKKAVFTGTLTGVVNRNGASAITTKLTSSWTVSSLLGLIVEGVNGSGSLVRAVIVADLGGGQAWVSIPLNAGMNGEDTFANGTAITVYDGVNLSPGGSPTIQTIPYGYVEFDYCRATAWEITGSYVGISNGFGAINCHGHIHNFSNCSMNVQLQAGIATIAGGYCNVGATQNTTTAIVFGVTVKGGIIAGGASVWAKAPTDVEVNATGPAITTINPDIRVSLGGHFYGTLGTNTQVVKFNAGARNCMVQFGAIPSLGAATDLVFTDAAFTGSTATLAFAQVNDTNLNRVVGPAGPTLNDNASQPVAHLGSGGTTLTNAANIGDVTSAVAALRTPKPFEHWCACVDQDGLTLAGNDTTGAIGIGVPGAQTRVVAVTGADSVVGSTHTWSFASAAFTANDLFGELVVGTATNSGKFMITTVVDATHVVTNGTQTNETFTGATTLTVIGGKAAVRDAALAAAKLTPFKSLERLGQVLPRFGNDAILLVLVRPRTAGATYTMMDGTTPADMAWSNNLAGWRTIVIRPTDNFVNDLDDKIRCGYQIVSGTNAGGYNPTAGATKSNLPCQLAGGGAAAIPLENFASAGVDGITGKRLRFLNSTTTTALRNSTSNVWRHDATSVVPGIDVTADPVSGNSGDIFVIEESAFRVWDQSMYLGVNGLVSIVGVVSVGTGSVSSNINIPASFGFYMSGCESPAGIHWGFGSGSHLAIVGEFYPDELYGYPIDMFAGFTTARVGHGYRGRLDMSTCKLLIVSCSTDISDSPRTWDGSHALVRIGPGCVFKNGFTWLGSSRGSTAQAQGDGSDTISIEFGNRSSCIGNDGITNYRRLRIPAPFVSWAINIVGGDIRIRGLDVSNCGSSRYPIKISGPRTCAYIDDVVSTDGNNGLTMIAMDFAGDYAPSYGATVLVGTKVANTLVASGGDISLADGVIASFSGLAFTNYRDDRGNNIIGPGGVII